MEGVTVRPDGYAYDTDLLREKIEDELGAQAQIRADPSRAIKPLLDPAFCAERHKVENFFQQIKHYCRIAQYYEKTNPILMGFVFLISALNRLRSMQTRPKRTKPPRVYRVVWSSD